MTIWGGDSAYGSFQHIRRLLTFPLPTVAAIRGHGNPGGSFDGSGSGEGDGAGTMVAAASTGAAKRRPGKGARPG